MKPSALLAASLTVCVLLLVTVFSRNPAETRAADPTLATGQSTEPTTVRAGQEVAARQKPVSALARPMVDAALAFLRSLPPELREKAQLDYNDERRGVWHYYPRVAWERTGVMLKELDPEQQNLFRAVLATGLSENGYETALNLMELEDILRTIENTEFARKFRDPERFNLTIFGEPSTMGRWAWKVEGHHLIVSMVMDGGQIVSATPLVVGANPGRVPSGPQRGLRILPAQEDLGRQLFTMLDPAQRTIAHAIDEPPFDVLTNADPIPARLPAEGLQWTAMSEVQQQRLVDLLRVYTDLLPQELSDRLIDEIRQAGMERVRFVWSGSAEPGRPHYYRVTGPTFVVEYCNSQNSGNHIHVVWRDYRNDLGAATDHGRNVDFPAERPR